MYAILTIHTLFYLFLGLCLAGCQPADDCLKSTGTITQKSWQMQPNPAIWGVEVFDNIDVVLIPATDSLITTWRVEAGAHLIDKITFRYNAATNYWELRNENTCNWVRSYRVPVKVYLACPTLQAIRISGYGNLSTQSTWKNQNYLEIRAFGTGSLQADIATDVLHIDYNSRGGQMQLRGKARKMLITTLNSNQIQAFELITQEAAIFHRGFGDIQVQVTEQLTGAVEEAGNIYVKGTPMVDVQVKQEGRVIFVP